VTFSICALRIPRFSGTRWTSSIATPVWIMTEVRECSHIAEPAANPLGSDGQVNVVVNGGPSRYPVFDVPWPWTAIGSLQERGVPLLGSPATFRSSTSMLRLPLEPFEVRVFSV
jgi:hypothetical protein